MDLGGSPNLGHLTYCTNIHAGESLAEVLNALRYHLPKIKAQVAADSPMGVGLRLSAAAVASLADPKAFTELRDLLEQGDFYVFTINGFPYGTFHGSKVKQAVYQPDWSEPARLDYSNALADVLVGLLPAGLPGSISTVPGTFKPWAQGRIETIVDNLIRHAAHLYALEHNTGKTIVLALEPEPCCLLETITETITFFQDYLFCDKAAARLAEISGISISAAALALRRHLGVCYDVCHAAVEFEDALQSVMDLNRAGIDIAKVQLSSALKISKLGPDTLDQLRSFDEPVYLHQVVARHQGQLQRYVDLPEAFAHANEMLGSEWRIHFHVPIFLAELEQFDTTQDFLQDILSLHRHMPITRQLEVETYTWDVLPAQYQNEDMSAAIARELNWVREMLLS